MKLLPLLLVFLLPLSSLALEAEPIGGVMTFEDSNVSIYATCAGSNCGFINFMIKKGDKKPTLINSFNYEDIDQLKVNYQERTKLHLEDKAEWARGSTTRGILGSEFQEDVFETSVVAGAVTGYGGMFVGLIIDAVKFLPEQGIRAASRGVQVGLADNQIDFLLNEEEQGSVMEIAWAKRYVLENAVKFSEGADEGQE